MKRIWLGFGILILFLAVGLWSSRYAQTLHEPLAHDLEKAAQTALSGNFAAGRETAEKARQQWDKQWHGTALLADHTPMDEIDGLFARLEIYAQTQNTEAFAACCHQLAKLITATGEAHSFTWWNIL